MGRKQQAKRLAQQGVTYQPVTSPPPQRDMAGWILSLPRLVRIILIALPSLAVSVIFVPVVDTIYLRYFYTYETRVLPSIIIAAIALTVYLIGWILVVGTAGEKPEERRAARLYLSASMMLMAIASVYLAVLMLSAGE
jgi:hypothetical protein